jgi:hypothetical protein
MVKLTTLSSLLAVSLAQAANITLFQPNAAFLPHPLPAPGPASNFDRIITQFNKLSRNTVWTLVKKIHFEGDTGEPEGMINIGEERYILGRGDWTVPTKSYGKNTIINGTDRSPGAGYAHLNIYDGAGKRVADVTLTPPDDIEYHIGGLDYDGTKIWATLAQYRPNTTGTIISIDPVTLEHDNIIHYADHLGGIVHDTRTSTLTTLNWGARTASIWDLNTTTTAGQNTIIQPYPTFSHPKRTVRNPSSYVDYQDCKNLGHSATYDMRNVMMCSGVATLPNNVTIGGLAIVDTQTMVPLVEVPLTMKSDLGTPMTQNPFDVDVVGGRLRLYFVPDQRNSTVYVYEPVV